MDAGEAEVIREVRRDTSHAARVVEGLGDRFGPAQVLEDPRARAQWGQRRPQLESKIDRLLVRGPALRKARQGLERLLEARHRFAVCRRREGFRARLPHVGDGLVPDLAAGGVVRQALGVLDESIRVQALDRRRDPGVQLAATLGRQALVRHLVRQDVLEGVRMLREETGLVQELGRLEVGEATVQGLLGWLSNSLQQS